MKINKVKSVYLIVFSLFLLNSCNSLPTSVFPIEKTSVITQKSRLLKGKAEFPESFSTKATIGQIAPFATVSLIYPPDHQTEANKTIATGLTDASGSFAINPAESFNPPVDSIYVLQAAKRIGSSGNDAMSLTTYVKWTGTGWQSMTFPDLYINTRTTALSIIAAYNTSTVSANDTIGKIDVTSGTSVPQNVNLQITSDLVTKVGNLVRKVLTANYDPLHYIYFDGNNYLTKKAEGLAPTWNPAKQMIVFQSDFADSSEIMGMYDDGTEVNNLTNNPAWDYYPSLSPDRSKIIFTSNRDGNPEIYVMAADGSNLVNISNNQAADFYPSWSPDGNKIVFVSDRDGNKEVYTMNPDGTGIFRVTNNSGDDTFPRWNQNSAKIVFSSNRSGNYQIYKIDPDGTSTIRLTVSEGFDSFPTWSPDGTTIAFVSIVNGNQEIMTMNEAGNFVTNISNNNASDSFPVWSPDSSKILFVSDRDGNNELYSMTSTGTNVSRITNGSAAESYPDWH